MEPREPFRMPQETTYLAQGLVIIPNLNYCVSLLF